ncbi:hypothetical protein BH09BAC6_BH09BAC6_16320 [soil metagenome]
MSIEKTPPLLPKVYVKALISTLEMTLKNESYFPPRLVPGNQLYSASVNKFTHLLMTVVRLIFFMVNRSS